MNYCGNCGEKLNQGAKFCPNCGKKLDDSVQTTQNIEPANQVAGNIPAQQPAEKPNQTQKRKGRKGLLLTLFILLLIIGAGSYFAYKYFFAGPKTLKAEYKKPSVNMLVKLDSSGKAPANLFGIMLKEGTDRGDAEDAAKLVNGNVVGEIEVNNVYQIEFNGKTREDLYSAIEKIKKSDKVDVAFPDGELVFDGAENISCNPFDDPFYDGKNGEPYKLINLKQAWDIIRATGVKLNDVTVGVVDSDINYGSDEINTGESIIVPLDKKDINVKGELTHGTMVTEIIGANGKNGGITGVASILGDKLQINTTEGNKIDKTSVQQKDKDAEDISQFEGTDGKIYTIQAMQNIQKQIQSGATIINCSFGNKWNNYTLSQHKEFSKIYKKFLERVQAKYPNVIIVGSAGNDKRVIEGTRIWSHKLDNLVTVGAVNTEGTWADYSNVAKKNTDDEVTVVTCGQNKMEDGKPHFGTSFAAPQVTGIIAMLRSIDPKITPAEIKKILTETSKQVVEKDADMQDYNQQLIQADDAVLKVIEKVTGKKFDKKKLLEMMNVNLSSAGGSPEFTITAELTAVGESGASLEIECTGGDYALGGEKTKKLSSAGSVTWKLTIPKPETIISVKVTRLDTKACRTILVGGKIEAKDLVGEWEGGTCWDSWSTPFKIAEEKIKASMLTAKGEFLPMTMTVSLISENTIHAVMKTGGAMPPPPLDFSFDDGNLEAGTTYMMTKYHFSGKVKVEGGKYVITGEWTGSNAGLKMNGRWKASMNIKNN